MLQIMDEKFLQELKQYVAIPSVSAQPAHKEDCLQAAHWMSDKLQRIGMQSHLEETGGHPLVMATHRSTEANAPHIVVYGHYDVQPVDTQKENWEGRNPFTMEGTGDKALARGVADNKGPTLALLYGLAAALKKDPRANITVLVEGEEEIGSPNLAKTLDRLAPQLGKVDAIVLSDTGSHSAHQLCVTTGTRGIMGFDIKIRGLARDLHSGNGGPVPNAARELARVGAAMFDAEGRVTLPGFYDGIIDVTPEQREGLKATNDQEEFKKAHGNRGFYNLGGVDPFVANRFMPSLELNGIYGGYQGAGSKTIIPAEAVAKFTCRIAPGQDHEQFAKSVIAGVKKLLDQELFTCEVDFHKKPMPAYNAPVPHLGGAADKGVSERFKDIFQAVHDSTQAVTGKAPLYVAEGASIPVLPDFRRILNAHAIMLGLAGEDAGMHSPQENADLPMLEAGMKVWEEFFESVGA